MTDAEDEYVVAVWLMRYGSPDYELHESEEDAASYAASVTDQGAGAVLGAQFADGRLIPVKHWKAYHTEGRRRREAEGRQRAEYAVQPPRPTRGIRDPFEHRQLEVEADEPAWLGEVPAPSNPA